tara:strand:+ start:356 stop:949 length:594 start_codon:yes stop_codon:yes gene_type:complete
MTDGWKTGGQPTKAARLKRQRAYLDALKAGAKPSAAWQEAGLSRMGVSRYRRQYKWFRDEEALHLKVTLKESQQYDYLDLLHHYAGNQLKARKGADVDPDELAVWRKDPKFLARENEEFESIPAEAEEQLTKAAIGRRSKLKDPALTMKVLGKWKPDQWGEKPREIEHKFSGAITVQNTTDQIMALLGEDVELDELE